MGVVTGVNPFSPNNSSSPNLKVRGEIPHKYTVDSHSQLNFDGVCVHEGRETTHRRRPIAASPNHTDNLLDFTFLLFCCCCCSSRLVWYVMHFFTFFSPLLTFLIFFTSFLAFLFFAHFFLLYLSSSFSRARVVFRLILFFFLLLLLWLLRPFSHAPPRLLIARNRCDFAHLYVFFLFYLPLMCLLVSFLREQLDYCD